MAILLSNIKIFPVSKFDFVVPPIMIPERVNGTLGLKRKRKESSLSIAQDLVRSEEFNGKIIEKINSLTSGFFFWLIKAFRILYWFSRDSVRNFLWFSCEFFK